ESEADVESAVAEAVGAVRESMTAKLEQQRATAAERLERVKAKAAATKTKAVERAVARTRTEEQRKAARAVANALADVAPEPTPPTPGGETDPRFDYCYNATDAGYGPYYQGETEYEWYDDADNDGAVCE
ncbi:MAG: excalibur calcium-binding domain-containing protein, partial [Nocardioides sp.]|nr:excalibur calcium-binding domain-containing protein [Nocardioides sp.]